MARQGRAGEALGISLIAGLVGGLFGLVVLVLATEPLANVALAFTPPAYFALGVLGSPSSPDCPAARCSRDLLAAAIGLMLAMVGPDPMSGVPRFTFGEPDLLGGIKPLLVMIGLFAVTEMLVQIGEPPWAKAERRRGAPQASLTWPMMKRLCEADRRSAP